MTAIIFTSFGTTHACRLMRERLESHLFSNQYQGLKFNPCRNERQVFKSHLAATVFCFFTNVLNIPKSTLSSTKALIMGYFLWHEYYCYTSIKNSTFAPYKLCKLIWKVMVYMILTGKGRLRLDKWREIFL